MTMETFDSARLHAMASSGSGWEMRQRVVESIGRIERMLENQTLACLSRRECWQALADDMEFGYRLLGYMESGCDGEWEESDGRLSIFPASLWAQCALFLANAARDLVQAEAAVDARLRRRRWWRYGAWGAALVSVSSAASGLVVLWLAFRGASGTSEDIWEKFLKELSAHPLDAVLFVGSGVALVHFAERHRDLPGLGHRIITMLPVVLLCVVILMSLIFSVLQDMGYRVSESSLCFNLKALGVGLGLTFLLRAYQKYRRADPTATSALPLPPPSAPPAPSSPA